MNRIVASLSIATAFAAGCSATHLLRPALAAENITAQVIHEEMTWCRLQNLEGDATFAPRMREKLIRSRALRTKVPLIDWRFRIAFDRN